MKLEGLIVHICPREAWQAAQASGEYRAVSLETEGFIHCSRPEQVLAVANRFYREVPDLVLLWIDPRKLRTEIRWEPVDGGELFPHVYGPINTHAVSSVTSLIADKSGFFVNF